MFEDISDERICEIIKTVASRSRNLVVLAERVRDRLEPKYSIMNLDEESEKFVEKIGDNFIMSLVAAYENLMPLTNDEWTDETILKVLMDDIPGPYHLTKKEVAQSLRIALTGYLVSEPIEQVIRVIRKENIIKQLKLWIDTWFPWLDKKD